METINKSYEISKEDNQIVTDYLQEVNKRSYNAYKCQKSAINNCLNYVGKDIQAISMFDIKSYFEQIDVKKTLKLTTKETKRSYLNSFFCFVQAIYLEQRIEFKNPVPNRKIYQFTQDQNDVKRFNDNKNEVYLKKELEEFLEIVKKRNFRDFIVFGLLTCTGTRISEMLTIKKSDVNLKERYFETGFEKDARKSTLRTKQSLLFFFPENFRPYLEQYIKYNDNIWLFPGRTSHYQVGPFSVNVRLNYDKQNAKFHKFRRTLITERMKLNCPLWISEGLMNHKSSSVEGEHYIKLSVEEKRSLYDKYFPYYDFFCF